jgi:transcriptional regulator with XRE-family HTH domain
MKTKKTPNPSLTKSIGHILRLIRTYKGESPDAVAFAMGYKYASSYCKVERGEINELYFEKLLTFCNHFHIRFSTFLFLLEMTETTSKNQLTLHSLQISCAITEEEVDLIDTIVNKRIW